MRSAKLSDAERCGVWLRLCLNEGCTDTTIHPGPYPGSDPNLDPNHTPTLTPNPDPDPEPEPEPEP